MSAERMPRVALEEIVDDAGLARLAATIVGDAAGMAEFGGFYGRAVERLGPLLGTDRRAWLIVADGGDAGFVDAGLDVGWVGLSWFVREGRRRRGVARAAVGRLFGLAPWPDAEGYLVAVDPSNAASTALARSTGFALDGRDEHGDERWMRPLPRPRAGGGDPRRFLDRGGRLAGWPSRPADLDAFLGWLVGETLAPGEVLDERTITQRLRRIVDDPAYARHLLSGRGFVHRTPSGSAYRLAVTPPAER